MEHLTSCLNPKVIRNRYTGELMCVPCGSCSACKSRHAALWVSRLREESCCHTFTLFGTLTYHNDFLPRQSVEFLDNAFYTDKFKQAVIDSSDFINANNGMIPCVSSRDIQLFFKRLRSKCDYYLHKNYGKDQKSNLRYFVCSEYGPTTFRPHYHLLIWFDNKHLYPVIKSYIFESWKSKTRFTRLQDFFQRNKWKFVSGHCEEYLAGYLNCNTNLPPILLEKPFRTFHLQSSTPPIGTIRILKESFQSLLAGDACTVSLRRLTSLQSVIVPLWRGLENRFFAKCLSFATLSHGDRIALYGISNTQFELEQKDYSFAFFKEWVLSKWKENVPTIRLLRCVATCSPEDGDKFERMLRNIYRTSQRIIRLSECAECTLSAYVSGIETYYARKDYDALKMQLQIEELMSHSQRKDMKLSFYPFLIDTLFYENLRNLPFSTYTQYLEQFGLGAVNDFMFWKNESLDFKEVKGRCDMIQRNNTKVRVKKDYVESHPECVYSYKDLLRSYCLTK